MSIEKKSIRNLGLHLLTAGVSGVLLASPVFAHSGSTDEDSQAHQDTMQQVEQAARAEFMQLDENNDQKLQRNELEMRLETPDLKDKWDWDKLMSEFDENDNNALELEEYHRFLAEVSKTKS